MILLLFFIKGAVHHAFGFAGIDPGGQSQIWHGLHMFTCQIGVFAILARRELGWFWLAALFICEVPIELTGAIRSYGGDFFAEQVVEVILDAICLCCVFATKSRYNNK